jgi:phosphate transport system protein
MDEGCVMAGSDGHIVKRYDQQLCALKGLVLEIGQYAVEQCRGAAKALVEGDVDLARQVVYRDRDINAMDIKAQESCVELLAMRQPLASDLRFVMAMSKSVNDIERAADEAKKLARITLKAYESADSQPSASIFHDVGPMAEVAASSLDRALDAIENFDVALAVDVVQNDDKLNEMFYAGMRRLSTFLFEDHRNVRFVIDAVFALKALERIGDHATNVAEQLIYAVKGKDVRYVQAEHLSGGFLDAR